MLSKCYCKLPLAFRPTLLSEEAQRLCLRLCCPQPQTDHGAGIHLCSLPVVQPLKLVWRMLLHLLSPWTRPLATLASRWLVELAALVPPEAQWLPGMHPPQKQVTHHQLSPRLCVPHVLASLPYVSSSLALQRRVQGLVLYPHVLQEVREGVQPHREKRRHYYRHHLLRAHRILLVEAVQVPHHQYCHRC